MSTFFKTVSKICTEYWGHFV